MDFELAVSIGIGLIALICAVFVLLGGKLRCQQARDFSEEMDEFKKLDPSNPVSPLYRPALDENGNMNL